MAYKLISDFAAILKGNPAFTVRGPISPSLMMIPWRRNQDHPLPIICLNKGRDSFMALVEKEYFAVASDMFAAYDKKKVSLKDLYVEYDALAEKVQALYDEAMSLAFPTLSDSDLAKYMKKTSQVFDEVAERTLYIETIDYDKILTVLGQGKKTLLDSVWETATHPTFISFEGRRLRYLLDLVSRGDVNAVRKARFIYTDYIWSKKDEEIKTSLNDIQKNFKKHDEECKKIEEGAEKRKKEYEIWRKGLSKEAGAIVDYVQMVMLFRDIRKDVIGQVIAVIVQLSLEFAHRAEIDEKCAPLILIYEYAKGVSHLKSIRKNIEKRIEGYLSVVYTDNSYEIELCDFDRALVEFNDKIFAHNIDVRTIKGQIANKGKMQGRVRIVLDHHEHKGFKEGDILVTSMTRPEFLPLMKKAGAVVTNEGGITCHAAIVSRELGIPCIIGTKIATRVLKDGDMVEVDAEKGVVTILNT